ncbi:MAG: GAF domain-containing sensor histidine kinase [Phormidium sp. BM_Day4_Bin.17]|nr:GAF domain-containing sensor histidine kinase [Phormidium sp. BM_Day4_Bin.17]UCJ12140.1 MAG: GAF domain-containing sensor histidine kinase [Phormidium sp. PBR-2020]
MPAAPYPDNEAERQQALEQYNLLDSLPEQDFDDITILAAQICQTPIALVSLIDRDRQWFKSKVGLDAEETPRDQAFCAHAILEPSNVLVVPNAEADPRFADNPLVTGGPQIRFYAGAPLQTPEGQAIGTLCTIDSQPREITPAQIQALQALSRQVVAQMELRRNVKQLRHTLKQLQRTQASLIQTEKMSALGRFVAGIAHEINNPVSFILGNLPHAQSYTEELLELLQLYQKRYPDPDPKLKDNLEGIDIAYIAEDFLKLLKSMKAGATRIEKIVQSLRTFSHLDEAEIKLVQLQEHLENTLALSLSQVREAGESLRIKVVKHYQELPPLVCHIGQLNQVFINIIGNAIDALQERVHEMPSQHCETNNRPTLTLTTDQTTDEDGRDFIIITIQDNGVGIDPDQQDKIFDPFYSSKPIGQGTGLGLTSSYDIVVKQHQGKLTVDSTPGQGSRFSIWLPTDLPLPD